MSEFDKKISALTSGTDSTATDEYVIARGGSNFKISGALVAAGATKVGTLASLAVTGNVSLGADVVLSRGAADRLDLASGDSLNIVSGTVKIAGTDVLGATTLGSGVTASSLTSVGTLASLAVTGDLTVDTSTLKVDSTDNRVGIGTASPGETLNVVGGTSTTSTLNVTGGNNNDNATIASDYSLNFQVDANNNIGGRAYQWRYGGKGYSDGTSLMTLDASGNVGIGVTPTVRFHVSGTGVTARVISTNNDYVLGLAGSAATDAAFLGTTSSGDLRIATGASGTERARITAGGYFKASNDGTYRNSTGVFHEMKSDAVGATLIVGNTNASANGDIFAVTADRNTTNNSFYPIVYYNDGATAHRFRVADSGDVTNTNNSYGSLSDVKLKQDITDAGSSWDDLKAVRFRKYRLKADVAEKGDDAKYMLGVIAQELREVSPGLVDSHPDTEKVKVEVEVEKSRPVMHEVEEVVTDAEGVESVVMKSVPMLDENGEEITETYTETETRTETRKTGTETLSVKQSILLMKAAVALQEAMARIESLEARLDALEN
jgi:hypothetical protein